MGLEGLFSRPPTPLNGLWDPHRVCPNNTDAGPTVKQGQEGHDGTGVAGGTGGDWVSRGWGLWVTGTGCPGWKREVPYFGVTHVATITLIRDPRPSFPAAQKGNTFKKNSESSNILGPCRDKHFLLLCAYPKMEDFHQLPICHPVRELPHRPAKSLHRL